MSESFHIDSNLDKNAKYIGLNEALFHLCGDEIDPIARMANITAGLKEVFGFWWVGFYRVVNQELVLGPFQGPVACQRIQYGKGVCGTAWRENKIIIVPNVNEFPGHIACSSITQSEIVIPILDSKDQVIAVLDVDSAKLSDFDEVDKMGLEQISKLAFLN